MTWTHAIAAEIANVEGSMGVAVELIERGERFAHHADELFPMASVFKVPLLIELFRQRDAGAIDLGTTSPIPAARTSPGAARAPRSHDPDARVVPRHPGDPGKAASQRAAAVAAARRGHARPQDGFIATHPGRRRAFDDPRGHALLSTFGKDLAHEEQAVLCMARIGRIVYDELGR